MTDGVFTGMGTPATAGIGEPGTPPADEGELSKRASEISAFFQRPEVMAGLLQFGAQMMQPRQRSQTFAGQLGASALQGAEAAGRVVERRQEREDVAEAQELARQEQANREARTAVAERQAAATERQAGVAERQVGVAERAEQRAGREGQQRIGLAESAEQRLARQQELDEAFRQDQLGFRKESENAANKLREAAIEVDTLRANIAKEANDIRREQMAQDLDVVQRRLDAEAERLAERLAAEAEIKLDVATLSLVTNLIKAEQNAALFENRPMSIDRVLEQARATVAAGQAMTRGEAAAVSTAPGGAQTRGLADFTAEELTPAEKAAVFASPEAEQALRNAWGDERVDALKREVQGE